MSSMKEIQEAQIRARELEGLKAENTEEFFNKNHSKEDGKFTEGKGGTNPHAGYDLSSLGAVIVDGKLYTAKEVKNRMGAQARDLIAPKDKAQIRKERLKKAALIAGAVALAAGVVFLGIQVNKNHQVNAAAEARAATHQIPGSKLHYTRRWTGKDKLGRDIHILDSSGKLTDDQAKSLLGHLSDIGNNSPLEGRAARLVVRDRKNSKDAADANGFVNGRPGVRTINLNYDNTYGKSVGKNINNGIMKALGWFTPAQFDKSNRRGGDPAASTIFHEYGHLTDFDGERKAIIRDRAEGKRGKPTSIESLLGVDLGNLAGGEYRKKRKNFWERHKNRTGLDALPTRGLSQYGRTSQYEGYAESFAEWHLSGGKTKNTTAQDYAREFGWTRY